MTWFENQNRHTIFTAIMKRNRTQNPLEQFTDQVLHQVSTRGERVRENVLIAKPKNSKLSKNAAQLRTQHVDEQHSGLIQFVIDRNEDIATARVRMAELTDAKKIRRAEFAAVRAAKRERANITLRARTA